MSITSKPKPSFSVVIPTYNRPEQLARCLLSLRSIDYPQEQFEIVVVDDGSSVDLIPIVEKVQENLNLRLIKQKNAGPGAARNRGVSEAVGDFIAFTDDDCLPHENWLSKLAEYLKESPTALVGGHTLNALVQNPYSSASQQLIDYLYTYYHDREDKDIRFFTSNNMGMSRQSFLAVGGFNSALRIASEDRELCDRWLQHGYPMQYAPDVNISHAHNLSLTAFWKQHFSYGRGAFYFHESRAQRQAGQVQLEPASFYINLLIYPIKTQFNGFQVYLSGLFFLSQVAMTVGYFWEKSRRQYSSFSSIAG